jgi:hypothetical protein
MDPASLAIVMKNLAPMLACIMAFGLPLGIVWVLKSHKVRMRELDIEAMHMPLSLDQRLQRIEARLSNIEQALSSRPQLGSPEEPDLLAAPPDVDRLRTR